METAAMKNHECRRKFFVLPLFPALIAALLISACTTSEKAKAQHVARGQALLKDKKFQEVSLEFRAALQIDDQLADAQWGLAQTFEGLQRYQEAFDEMKQVVELDKNNLDVRVKLGNYYLVGAKQSPTAVTEAERLAKEVLQKDPNHIEGRILMGSVLFAQDRKKEAFDELNSAIAIDPKRVPSIVINEFARRDKSPTTIEELGAAFSRSGLGRGNNGQSL
jgi:tetratricopeptide (TPR) repeat protein